MSYTAPAGNAVVFRRESSYTAPAGNAVVFSFVPLLKIACGSLTNFKGTAFALATTGMAGGSVFKPETQHRDLVISMGTNVGFITWQRSPNFAGGSVFTVVNGSHIDTSYATAEVSTPDVHSAAFFGANFNEQGLSYPQMLGVTIVTRKWLNYFLGSKFTPKPAFNKDMTFTLYGSTQVNGKGQYQGISSFAELAGSTVSAKSIARFVASLVSPLSSACAFQGVASARAATATLEASATNMLSAKFNGGVLTGTTGSLTAFASDYSTGTIDPSPPADADCVFVRSAPARLFVVTQ